MSWNNDGSLFFVTTGLGTVEVTKYPELKSTKTLQAHTANIFCIEFDPLGK
jgi:THO complex subunit 3